MAEHQELDIRLIEPRHKHPTIFNTFDALDSGESFILVNDHDPMPLRFQFESSRPEQFEWHYLQKGPQVWKVRLVRI